MIGELSFCYTVITDEFCSMIKNRENEIFHENWKIVRLHFYNCKCNSDLWQNVSAHIYRNDFGYHSFKILEIHYFLHWEYFLQVLWKVFR